MRVLDMFKRSERQWIIAGSLERGLVAHASTAHMVERRGPERLQGGSEKPVGRLGTSPGGLCCRVVADLPAFAAIGEPLTGESGETPAQLL